MNWGWRMRTPLRTRLREVEGLLKIVVGLRKLEIGRLGYPMEVSTLCSPNLAGLKFLCLSASLGGRMQYSESLYLARFTLDHLHITTSQTDISPTLYLFFINPTLTSLKVDQPLATKGFLDVLRTVAPQLVLSITPGLNTEAL